jgi:hypothetical protein
MLWQHSRVGGGIMAVIKVTVSGKRRAAVATIRRRLESR